MIFVLESNNSFEATCIALRQAVDAAKWALLGGYDFTEVLAGKGFPTENRYKTFEICQARYASEMLEAESLIALCMPCTIAVIEEAGKVRVASAHPSIMLSAVFSESLSKKGETLDLVDRELKAILDAATGHA